MATALNLHREPPPKSKTTPAEKELRRHLFWTCYILDRFTACGSKRSSLLEDRAIRLRLPSWRPHANALPLEGEYFNTQSNLHCHLGPARSQGSMGMLIDATRILGNTNNYLAAGGVKGDSHFPWHALSNLSKIRADLDVWAQGNDDVLANPTGILTQSDGVTLMLSKLTYHLIHCLIYRPFLPIDLAELRGTGQHQSWQIEATNLCFMHANAITELAQFARQTPAIEWPSFIGYCLATAGTVHVHGAHYKGNEGEIYSSSAGYLSLEMQQLLELRYTWACIQHQKETLQTIYLCHTELVKTLANSPMRFSPVFHLEDFFDRYPGHLFDGAHVPLMDVVMEARNESLMGHIRERNEQIVTLPSSGPSSSRGSTFQKPNTPLSASFLHKSQVPMHQTNGRTKSRRLTGSASISSLAQHDLNGELPSQEHPQTITEMHLNQIPSILNFPSPLPHTLPSQIINPFSPSFTYSPLPQGSFDSVFGTPAPLGRNGPPDSGAGVPTTHQHVTTIGNNHVYSHYDPSQHVPSVITPGGRSVAGSTQQDGDTDPFLTLLEQLAENEHSRGGPSELDFYLGPQDG
ncbi:hypothetical protein MMC25_002074 [Agyrium rufum]|nr:hypothetical protein [Agyrium rufum]